MTMTHSKEELEKQILEEQTQEAPTAEYVEQTGKQFLKEQLNVLDVLKDTVTFTGLMKALKLALVHEVAPELQKNDLIHKQQFMAAHIAKAIDLVFNIKMAQLSQKQKEEETQNVGTEKV